MFKKRKELFIFLLLVFFVPQALAAQTTTITLASFEDLEFEGSQVHYELESLNQQFKLTGSSTLDQESSFLLILEDLTFNINLFLNRHGTEFYDYFGTSTFHPSLSNQVTIFLSPIGSLKITLDDSKLDDVIRITCDKNYGASGLFVVDNLRVLKLNNVPTGVCEVRATYEDKIIVHEVSVEKGELTEFNFKIEDNSRNYLFFFYSFLIAFLVVIVFLFTKIYFKEDEINKKSVKEDIELNQEFKSPDFLKFLDKKERKVVEFLLDKDYANQASIVYGCNIAKTSLIRVLKKLEAKNIVKIEKIGKTKKISFNKELNT